MKAIKFLIAVCLVVFNANTFAQTSIQIGDTLPNLKVSNLLKSDHPPLTTKQLYQSGALMINFWATWCPPCIKEMQLLAKELEKHPGKLNVLSVTYESPELIKRFLSQHPEIKNSSLHLIAGDTVLNKLFFHRALPHNVWVGQLGEVKAITGGAEVTPEHIASFVSGRVPDMYTKKEMPFDSRQPLQVADTAYLSRSLFLKRMPGVQMTGSVVHYGKMNQPVMKRFLGYNMRILTLFWLAHQMPGTVDQPYLYEVCTKDSAKYFWPGEGRSPNTYQGVNRETWARNNTYTYEYIVSKPQDDSTFLNQVQKDLEFNLKVKSSRAYRPKVCYVVTLENECRPEASKVFETPVLKIENGYLIFSGITIDYLLNWMVIKTVQKGENRKEPYLNQTGVSYLISGKVNVGTDLLLHRSREHLEACLSKALGLQFNRKQAMYPILVLRDSF